MEDKITILTDGLYEAANSLSTYILGSCAFLLSVLLIKLFAKEKTTFKILDVEIPLKMLWIVVAAYTLGHFYFALILNQRINRIKQKNIQADKEQIWTRIIYGEKTGSLFTGMEKRIKTKEFLGLDVYTMRKSDVTTYISLIISGLLFGAFFNYKAPKKQKLLSAYFGLIFCIINWTIGSWWAINISTLAP